jgi:hypothetical protein
VNWQTWDGSSYYYGPGSSFTVPSGVSSLAVELVGAPGGSPVTSSASGGAGGKVTFRLAVTAGDELLLWAGEAGADVGQVSAGGRGIGSNGGRNYGVGGSGGGGSRLIWGPNLLAPDGTANAGGGGGAGDILGGGGGDGGQVGGDGGDGTFAAGMVRTPTGGGGADGGTSAGGAGLGGLNAVEWQGSAGSTNGNGGIGGGNFGGGGGGGGGGYYGGGGGGGGYTPGGGGGGGGGSSHVAGPGVSDVVYDDAFLTEGNGWVTIQWASLVVRPGWKVGML